MKYLVLSDIHGNRNYLNRVLAEVPDIKDIIFLGDGLSEMLDVKRQNPEYNITAVTGNCDFLKDVPSQEILNINGYRVLVCHGDGYYVKMGLLPIKKACRELKADVALFGHTHRPYYEYDNGLYLFNPGSVTISPATLTTCYGIVDFSGDRPVFEHREIDVLKRD